MKPPPTMRVLAAAKPCVDSGNTVHGAAAASFVASPGGLCMARVCVAHAERCACAKSSCMKCHPCCPAGAYQWPGGRQRLRDHPAGTLWSFGLNWMRVLVCAGQALRCAVVLWAGLDEGPGVRWTSCAPPPGAPNCTRRQLVAAEARGAGARARKNPHAAAGLGARLAWLWTFRCLHSTRL